MKNSVSQFRRAIFVIAVSIFALFCVYSGSYGVGVRIAQMSFAELPDTGGSHHDPTAEVEVMAVTDKTGKLPFPAGIGLQVTQGTDSAPSHNGTATRKDIDLDTPNNTDEVILAPASGTAYIFYDNDNFGNHVNIDAGPADSSNPNGQRHFWVDCHAKTFLISNGQQVVQGQPIAMEGCTGNCTGDHIHHGLHLGNPQLNAENSTSVDNALISSRDATAGETSFTQRRTTQFIAGHWYESNNSYPSSTLTTTDWNFATDSRFWHLGPNGGATTIGFNAPGAWILQANNDPQIISPLLDVQTASFNRISITIGSLATDTTIAVYFATATSPNFSDSKKFVSTITPGGGYHTTTIPLTGNSEWQGRVTRLRIDPVGNGSGQAVGIQRVRMFGDGGGGGECTATLIASGQTSNGSLASGDCVLPGTSRYYDAYTFNGVAGTQVAISQTSSAFDTYLYLRNSANVLLAEDNNSGPGTSSRIPGTTGYFTLPATGSYIIQASSASDGLTGNYTISLSECLFNISSTDNEVGPGNGSTNFQMDCPTGCNWSASSDSSWLTTTSSGSGDGSVGYNYDLNNTTSPRVGRITVGGRVHTVTQIGLGGAGNVRFSAAVYTSSESGGSATIVVSRSGGSGTGTVRVSTGGGTATPGVDYTAVTNHTLLFVSDGPTASFVVPILNDSIAEGNETIGLTMSNPSMSLTLGNPTAAILTVLDDDAPPSTEVRPFDFDGDRKTDLSILRPNGASSEWWWLKSGTGGNGAVIFGASTDTPVPVDYTGDGKTDVAFWRPATGQWFVLRSEDFSFYAFPFGATGDVPAPADYDGDGKADAAVFRESAATWYINRSAGGTDIVGFGAVGDKPVNADYDGDGKSDIAIYRPNGTNGAEWWIRRSSNASVYALQFGNSTDKAVPGDFTGDGKADVAFWRPLTGFWNVLRSEDFSYYAFPFGANGDIASPGDYDGDGKLDAAVFRPSSATWFANRSTAGTLIQQFGQTGDIPVPSAFVR